MTYNINNIGNWFLLLKIQKAEGILTYYDLRNSTHIKIVHTAEL